MVNIIDFFVKTCLCNVNLENELIKILELVLKIFCIGSNGEIKGCP